MARLLRSCYEPGVARTLSLSAWACGPPEIMKTLWSECWLIGWGVDSAQPRIAEVGPQAAVFPSTVDLCSGVGTGPGPEESAEQSQSDRSPQGNRPLRRLLN
jgi:hypothetical protein